MTLTLSIRNVERLDNGMPIEFVLHRRGGVIGRGTTCDWCLPDLNNYISSRHCEVQYRGQQYVLVDVSTNGTYLNGANARMPTEHRIGHGDVLQIGHYEIVAALSGKTATMAPGANLHDFSANGAAPDPPAPPKPVPEAKRPSSRDVWSKVVADNAIDWARGGFNPPEPAALGEHRLPSAPPADTFFSPGSQGGSRAPRSPEDEQVDAFLAALGVSRLEVAKASPETITKAAGLLRRLVSGLMVMVQARAKAKSQMRVESTSFEHRENNPIKFANSPEQILAQLLAPTQRGFMEAEQAIDDAFYDLQSHQMALLRAMQGALQATLARFSPTAIQERAEMSGILARIMPAARDAALWQNYQREFSGVAAGSDEAFMDVFAEEFRRVYEEQSRVQRKR